MGFNPNRNFNEPIFKTESKEVEKFVIIAFEGAETEHQYFSHIKKEFKPNGITIACIKRGKGEENSSSPTKVAQTIIDIIEDKERLTKIKNECPHDFDDSYDLFWIVVDREKQESKKVNLTNAIKTCKEHNIQVSLTNPAFEFWLLLHFDISKYSRSDLLENKKTSEQSKRFLETALISEIGQYNKSKLDTKFITFKNISLAVEQEVKFENDLDKIIDKLGSNVGNLMKEILGI
ncbi:MAG: Unknown protein [uncultured Campylobacterales bacterium]|uniref:RloB domain-containing protein n=1 Tax=uncultured Campylobacterales bacterium TaxID=352960 RepID=A0A6S6SLV4_9BACT|nr:MAG: Unknown protein [uncultured Campylobacterales bacterium]